MNSGKINHSYFGECSTYILPHTRVIELRRERPEMIQWLQFYHKYKKNQWSYCLFPADVQNAESEFFKADKVKPRELMFHIKYEGFYAVSLAQQIRKRQNKKFHFTSQEILYVMGNIVKAWRQWEEFCIAQKFKTANYGISSSSILLNEEGDIKLITNLSSPLSVPMYQYYAPENCPPSDENFDSWNKSIAFSIGLIGFEMISLQLATPFYSSQTLKFNFEEYEKWLEFTIQKIISEKDNEQIILISNIIRLLTDKNPFIRLKIGELQALLHPYIKNILQADSVVLDRKQSHSSLLAYLKNGRSDLSQF